jgi:pimeloyl-ACP methyl ester carboxylesterase
LVGRLGPLARSGRAIAARFVSVLAYDALRAGPWTTWRRTRELLAATDRAHLSKIAAPTLLLWGEHDPLVPPAIGRVLREEIPDARLLVLPGAGHVPMYERPAALNDAVLRFLGGEAVGE